MKFAIAVRTILEKTAPNGIQYTTHFSRAAQEVLLSKNEILQALGNIFPILLEKLEKFVNLGSGWILNDIRTVWIDIANYAPLAGRRYFVTT